MPTSTTGVTIDPGGDLAPRTSAGKDGGHGERPLLVAHPGPLEHDGELAGSPPPR